MYFHPFIIEFFWFVYLQFRIEWKIYTKAVVDVSRGAGKRVFLFFWERLKGGLDKNNTLMIFLFCHFCWLLLWWNYWRSIMLCNTTSWSRLKLTGQIQFALHPCDPFLIKDRSMTGNSVEKYCFFVLNVKLQVNLDSKRFINWPDLNL